MACLMLELKRSVISACQRGTLVRIQLARQQQPALNLSEQAGVFSVGSCLWLLAVVCLKLGLGQKTGQIVSFHLEMSRPIVLASCLLQHSR